MCYDRRPTPYLFNIVFVVWIIVHCNVVVVAIEPSDLSDRMSVTLTLLLTTVSDRIHVLCYTDIDGVQYARVFAQG